MAEGSRPYVWQMVKEAVEALGSPTTNVAVKDRILREHPRTNRATIQTQIIYCTVNHPSRVHAPDLRRPMIANRDRFVAALGGRPMKDGHLLGPFAVPGGRFVPSPIPLWIGKVQTRLR